MSNTTTETDMNLIIDWLLGDKYSKVTFFVVIETLFKYNPINCLSTDYTVNDWMNTLAFKALELV